MFVSGKTAAVSGATIDAQFNQVTMLLHGDGTNGGQNNTFLDSGPSTFSITRNGNTTQGSFSPYGSNWSNFFDGSGDYLTSTWSVVGANQFTCEAWVYITEGSNRKYIIGPGIDTNTHYDGFGFEIYGQILSMWASSTGTSWNLVTSDTSQGRSANSIPVNTWTHVVMTRNSSGQFRSFINGMLECVVSPGTTALADSSTTVLNIGRGRNLGDFANFAGYISNLRVVNGSVVTAYSTSSTTIGAQIFTSPTAPLTAIANTSMLTCAENRFKDASTNNYTVTLSGNASVQRFNPFGTATAYDTSVIGGSGYFDGSGDYLGVPYSANLTMTGDFTAECWVYITSAPESYGGILAFSNDSEGVGWNILIGGSTSKFHFNVAMLYTDTATSMTLNAWTHLALVRSGSTGKLYINGVADANTVTTSATATCPTNPQIGRYPLISNRNFFGYISNVRVVKGTAVYTTNFTPPTAPVTSITNTQLLLNYINGAIFDNAMMNDLETVGNAQISTSVVKYGTGSLYTLASAGDTDYFVQPASQSVNFGTGNFTIEFWLNPSAILTNWASGNYAAIMDTDSPVGTGTDWWVIHQQNDTIAFGSNSAVVLASSSVLTANVWQHVAIVRNGSNITIYVNGTSAASATYATTIGGNRRLTIATQLGGSRWYKGYIDDLRITKGYARYTATFTPPTAAFSNTGPN